MADAGDPELAAQAAGGDAAAFEELVHRYHARVLRWAMVIVGDRDDAADVAQNVWIRVYRDLADLRDPARFPAWLYRTAYRVACAFRRTDERRSSILGAANRSDLFAQAPSPAEGLDAERLEELLLAALAGLPPRQRAVYTLAELEERPMTEIAAILGIPAVTVRTNLFRARRAVRAWILRTHPGLGEDAR